MNHQSTTERMGSRSLAVERGSWSEWGRWSPRTSQINVPDDSFPGRTPTPRMEAIRSWLALPSRTGAHVLQLAAGRIRFQ